MLKITFPRSFLTQHTSTQKERQGGSEKETRETKKQKQETKRVGWERDLATLSMRK